MEYIHKVNACWDMVDAKSNSNVVTVYGGIYKTVQKKIMTHLTVYEILSFEKLICHFIATVITLQCFFGLKHIQKQKNSYLKKISDSTT